MNLKEQVVLDHKGKPIAIQIPMNQNKKLMARIEKIEDIKACDSVLNQL